jgi:diaminohydroxyphosphoribosylaminopyrimidine deaminase/5-amino-6-(5-phosphoribosylamino)uracil reductase
VVSDTEQAAMRAAIAASAAAVGSTNPRPCVGAVVLDAGGAVVGTGVTALKPGPHAEVAALAEAGDRARGGTIVVTLEPCSGSRPGPRCADAVIAAGITRVVFAVTDPNPQASGGADQLRAAGIDVAAGVLAAEAGRVLGPWTQALGRGRPYVTWKYAATLDGRTAAADGSSRWITGEAARTDVHRERAQSDAVIVGVGTVLADDPQLTVRDWPATRQPARIVVDSDARTPLASKILDGAAATVVVVADDADSGRVTALRRAGTDVVEVPRLGRRVDLAVLMDVVQQREMYLLLLEGGATLAASFLRAGLVDRVVGYYAPALLGAGVALVGDLGIDTMTAAMRLELADVARIGDDVRVVAHVMTGSG